MTNNIFQKIVIATCLVFFTTYLPVTSEASSEEGEEFVQLRTGEGRIEQIDTEGVTIDDLYFKFSDTTRYIDLNDQDTGQSHMVTGMYVSFILNLDETVSRIHSMDKNVAQKEKGDVRKTIPKPSKENSMYQENGVWKN